MWCRQLAIAHQPRLISSGGKISVLEPKDLLWKWLQIPVAGQIDCAS
jgi:hypothetical protein